ncbi:HAD family hydrolase [Solitalea lacus]|uniref:HAD family hydrolase n=1 Tax=Solitalea lacus TaxID=2911172 RepID=UPI001EDB0881|nr:HAD family hydrolase [Solitalea lacus]UKJ06550.1 haloacid dehalogenase-like hydrolase [Solitalea lacus]
MKRTYRRLLILLLINLFISSVFAQSDPLPSWNDGEVKKAIIAFVEKTTKEGTSDFIRKEDRIATFDNDGTLWSEQPVYFQLFFAIDRIKAMSPQHPEWKTKEPFKSVLANDMKGIIASGEKGLLEIIIATHSGMTTDEYDQLVTDWFKTARHPTTKHYYYEMIYKPMVELLAYLRAYEYKTYIVSGGGLDFMRAFAPEMYGIPPDQIVGSMGKVKYEFRNGKPVLVKLPEVDFIDDKEGKPIGIHKYIGKRPVLAFGNSDGDFQMLEWTTSAPGPRMGLIVHHTDSLREVAYDHQSSIGTLDKALTEAPKRGWLLIDMKKDWKKIFSFD